MYSTSENLINRIEKIRLIVIGSGTVEKGMKKMASELDMQASIIFKGRVSDKELSKIVASSWLNVHTAVTEGWGLSILEVSASGTPTVAYNVPGVRDYVEDGLNGIKVKNGDRKALADAAYSIITNPERLWSSSVKVAQKYSWDKTAELWELLIKEITKDDFIK